ncbi:hypothetical protein ACFRAM_21370 [Paenibacillus sp. NPDC056722]|uniref:hypothetical protein n=1 Tax=Paenibacillus sp. NPDC056722 TaxID=3345924 RepID=UPI0036CCC0EF
MKKRTAMIVGMILMLVLLSGCAKGSAHVTVHKNGSVDLAVHVKLDSRTESLISGKAEQMLTDKLAESGIELHKVQDGKDVDYQFMKSYSSIEELKAQPSGSMNIVDAKVITDPKWLYTKYDLEVQPTLSAYSEQIIDSLGMLNIPKSFVRMFMESFAFDFQLTLPVNVYGPNNATSQDGRTLTWHMSLGNPEPLKLVVYAPNIKNIVITLVAVIVILVLLITLWLRRKRGRDTRELA